MAPVAEADPALGVLAITAGVMATTRAIRYACYDRDIQRRMVPR